MTTDIFIAGKGILYRIDPRTKIPAAVSFCIYVFLPIHFYSAALFATILFFCSIYSLGLKNTIQIFKTVFPMLFIMLLFSPLYNRDGIPLLKLGTTVVLTKDGLLQTALLDIRFFSITFVCSLLFATTKMEEIILALESFRMPYKAGLTISLVFTAVPGIIDSFHQISDSHKLRRATMPKIRNTLKNRIRNILPTLTSALVVTLRNIPALAMSLEARGFGSAVKRTQYHDLSAYRHPFRDTIAFGVVFIVLFIASKK